MSATYFTDLSNETSWVRFLVGDVDMARPMLQDEELTALLAKQTASASLARRYFAAAEALAILHTRWMSGGRGKSSKKVSQLQVVYGTGSGINIDLALQARIKELRVEGSRLEAKGNSRPFPFRTSRT